MDSPPVRTRGTFLMVQSDYNIAICMALLQCSAVPDITGQLLTD